MDNIEMPKEMQEYYSSISNDIKKQITIAGIINLIETYDYPNVVTFSEARKYLDAFCDGMWHQKENPIL